MTGSCSIAAPPPSNCSAKSPAPSTTTSIRWTGERYVERLLREGLVDDFETQLKRKDGEPCWCSISSRLIDFHGEKVIVSHTYDLTDRIKMQQELERQRETLHQNEKLSALGGLLAGVAHELNNPLSVVLGLSLMLKETATDAKTVERADKISKAAERCARIVKTFLAMARQQPTRTSNVAIDDVIAAAIEVAGYSIRSSDIELSVVWSPTFRPIWADPDQLSQVLINLLVNAEQALHDWDGRQEDRDFDAMPSRRAATSSSRSPTRDRASPRRSCRASSNRSSRRRRSAREPESACPSATASSSRMAEPSGSRRRRAADRPSSSRCRPRSRLDERSRNGRGGAAESTGLPAWWWTTKRRSAS